MFPWRRKRDWNIDDDFFRGLDDEFRDIEENIAKMFEEMTKMPVKESGESGPYVYGFSMRMGPEGKPQIEEFGNIPSMVSGEIDMQKGREPMTDVIEGDKEISIIAELPGIEKKDIDLNIDQNSLEINVDTHERKYHKRMNLPCDVKPDKAKATFKNGVLEVKIERVEEKKKKNVKIRID